MEKTKCEICLSRPARYKCSKCGREVCEEHYIASKGICTACEETLCQLCGENLAIGNCKYCGRLVCYKCSVEEGAALVCRECLQKLSTGTRLPKL
ncbi:MAG: hypothetical protein LM573_06180 [Thermofilum sp.]|uniref:hypothetical protein n=1 Tax=Thermofilum sp. TaxID=1961369 RepID=UPI00258DB5B7|nr:hypothetical protein [Thermofilum sp.]MCC5998648.1 hypothetical protein [Thermofilum sp.]